MIEYVDSDRPLSRLERKLIAGDLQYYYFPGRSPSAKEMERQAKYWAYTDTLTYLVETFKAQVGKIRYA